MARRCMIAVSEGSRTLHADLSKGFQNAVEEMKKFWEGQVEAMKPDKPDLIVIPECSDRFHHLTGETRLEYYRTRGDQMLDSVTAYADGTKVTGSIQSKSSSDLTASGATVTAPAGYYSSAASKSVATGTAKPPTTISGSSATLTTGTNTITLQKTLNVTPQVTAGYISSGTQDSVLVSLNANVTTKAAATITPGTTNQTIASGTYLTGTQTIAGDSDLVSGNIVAGKSIFGVNGSAQIPSITQDSTTKVLSIS